MLRSTNMSWDFFISHASEDKEDIARPLAEALLKRGFRVWYDEFSLRLGDSLRRSIDRGLAHSKYGIVILSPNFFAKEWPQRELDGLVALEIEGGKKIIPIWHKVGYKDVLRFSPPLADKIAVLTLKGLDTVVKEIIRAVQPTSELVVPSRGIEKYLFLVGCGVGERIGPILPEGYPTKLNELIDGLNRIGLSESPETKKLIGIRNTLTSRIFSLNIDVFLRIYQPIFQQFYDAIDNLPDVVQAHVSPGEYRWFKLGMLLLDLEDFLPERFLHKDLTTRRTFTLPILVKLSAVESLIEQMDIPTAVRRVIKNLMDAVEKEGWTDRSREDIRDIKFAIYDWLEAKA